MWSRPKYNSPQEWPNAFVDLHKQKLTFVCFLSYSTCRCCVFYNHFVESWKARCSLAKGRDLIKLMVTWGQCGLWLAPVSALWLVAASYQLEEVFQKSKSVKWLCCEIFIFSFFLLHQDELVFKWRRIFRRDEFFSVENIASFSTAHSHLYAVLENASVYHCTKIELTYILYFINILHGEYFV